MKRRRRKFNQFGESRISNLRDSLRSRLIRGLAATPDRAIAVPFTPPAAAPPADWRLWSN
jgi:hypothetical protein